MIVDRPDALKEWMADILEHMSDAQPAKLARYVLALVRKSSSPERLRDTVLEQLDVFLHEGAPEFADRLLETLASGAYTARPSDGRVVTLPVPPPPRRQVHLPPDETDSPADVPIATGRIVVASTASTVTLGATGLPSVRLNSSSIDDSDRAAAVETNGGGALPSSDATPVADLRLKLGGAAGRLAGRGLFSAERGTNGSPRECSPDRVPSGPVPPTPAQAPFCQPQSPPTAAAASAAEPGQQEQNTAGLTQSLPWPALPAGAARQQAEPTPVSRSSSSEQNRTGPLNTCSLHLKGVPEDLNQIMPLNDFMSRFGRVVNIQVSFGHDPAAALVTFDTPEEAKAALSAPEPILGCTQITARPHATKQVIGGRKMALSGLKRTVANPEAARRVSELDSYPDSQPHSQSNGDSGPEPPAAVEDPPDRPPPLFAPPPAAGAEAGARFPSEEEEDEEAVVARRQSAEARRQEIRRSQDLLAANVALEAKRKEKQQAARRLAVELQRREADLLERQLEQQRHLLTRLDSPGLKPAEKQTLLAALRALQTAALSTRARLAAALQRETTRPAPPPAAHQAAPHPRGAMRRPRPADARDTAGHGDQPVAKLPAGLPQETEREVLDLELALYQRQLAGAETEELQERLSRLRQAAVPTRGRGRGTRARGRGRGGVGRGGAPNRLASSIDRRPCTLVVSDFAAVGRAATVAHLSRFGELTDCRPGDDPGALVVTFGTRWQAEAALAGGATVGVHRLSLAWPSAAPAAVKSAMVASDAVQSLDMDLGTGQAAAEADSGPLTNLSDFEDDEGEDADDEDERSWRR